MYETDLEQLTLAHVHLEKGVALGNFEILRMIEMGCSLHNSLKVFFV